jgi:cytochrome c oxidase cbb3-type subunit 2
MVGVPYDDAMIAAARADLEAQVDPDSDGVEALQQRYPGAQARNFDAQAGVPTEMDALIAYLQVLGTMVDFKAYKAEDNYR